MIPNQISSNLEILQYFSPIIQKQSVLKNIILGQFHLKRIKNTLEPYKLQKNILFEKYFGLLPKNYYGSVHVHPSS